MFAIPLTVFSGPASSTLGSRSFGSGKTQSTLLKEVIASTVAFLAGLKGTVITSSFLADLTEARVDGFFSGATVGSNFSLNLGFHETAVATAIGLLEAFAGARSPDEKNLRTFLAGGSVSGFSEVADGKLACSDSGTTKAFFLAAAEGALCAAAERCCRDFALVVLDESEALRFRFPGGCIFPALSRRFGALFFEVRLLEV